jgi:hypothetical protein
VFVVGYQRFRGPSCLHIQGEVAGMEENDIIIGPNWRGAAGTLLLLLLLKGNNSSRIYISKFLMRTYRYFPPQELGKWQTVWKLTNMKNFKRVNMLKSFHGV